jgi:hypothetical protein
MDSPLVGQLDETCHYEWKGNHSRNMDAQNGFEMTHFIS